MSSLHCVRTSGVGSSTAGHSTKRDSRAPGSPAPALRLGAAYDNTRDTGERQDGRQAAEQTTHPSRSRRTKPSTGGFLVLTPFPEVGGAPWSDLQVRLACAGSCTPPW